MRFRKNEMSLVVWIIYLIMVGVLITFSGMTMKNELEVPLWLFLISCGGGLAIFALLFFLSNGISASFEEDYSVEPLDMVVPEKIFLIVSWMGAIGIRVYRLLSVTGASMCYDLIKVTDDGTGMIEMARGHEKLTHAGTTLYLSTLDFFLKLFGNSYITAATLQIVLQLLGLFLLFLGIRKMTGRLCSDLFLFFNAFLPYSARMAVECTPDAFYSIFFGVGLLVVYWFLLSSSKRIRKERNIVAFFVCGLVIGAITYLDISGLCLLCLTVGCMNISGIDEEETANKGAQAIVVVCALISFLLCIGGKAIFSSQDYGTIFDATFSNYEMSKLNLGMLLQDGEISFWIVFVFSSLGVFTYLKRKEDDVFSIWVIAFAVMVLLKVTQTHALYQDNSYLFFVFLTILSALSISELFYAPCFEQKAEETEEELVNVTDLEHSEIKSEMSRRTLSKLVIETASKSDAKENRASEQRIVKDKMEEDKTSDGEKKEDVKASDGEKKERKYIKNPLPVPKKKERKGLDYPLQLSEEDLKFDIEISDDDDYDLKD